MVDICCIGHITLDRIIVPGTETSLNGGTSYYFTHAIRRMGDVDYKLITSLAEKDMAVVDEMRRKGVDVSVIPSKNTVFFENRYGENRNNRTQRVLATADPFTVESLNGVDARFIHLGSLLADDFSVDVISSLKGRGIISVDAQGFLRYVDGETVKPCDWKDKLSIFPMIDILKINEHEIEPLTGYKNPRDAGRKLAELGVKEVVITLGSYGSLIYAEGKFYEIQPYKPNILVDATGCGDTYAAGYLYMRSKGAKYRDCGKFASAMSTLKLERIGAFKDRKEDILRIIGVGL
ncbi:MAG: PfkB family carbohydrate kinase [Muribaculaceae bacterium]|nr:PfkB family carbohydrate kinase [Muribaculaceae bacterium]